MKKGWYFVFLLILAMVMLVSMQSFAQVVTGGEIDVPMKQKVFGFLKDINALNIALIAFATFAGGMWAMGRNKLKQIGEIFLKAYEYTDDKRLSADERQDLIQRFLAIIGRSSVPGTDTVKKKK